MDKQNTNQQPSDTDSTASSTATEVNELNITPELFVTEFMNTLQDDIEMLEITNESLQDNGEFLPPKDDSEQYNLFIKKDSIRLLHTDTEDSIDYELSCTDHSLKLNSEPVDDSQFPVFYEKVRDVMIKLRDQKASMYEYK